MCIQFFFFHGVGFRNGELARGTCAPQDRDVCQGTVPSGTWTATGRVSGVAARIANKFLGDRWRWTPQNTTPAHEERVARSTAVAQLTCVPSKGSARSQGLDPAADTDRKPFVMRPVSILIALATGLSGLAALGATPKWEQMDYGSFFSSSVTLPWSKNGEIVRERIFRWSTTEPSTPSPDDSTPLPSRLP